MKKLILSVIIMTCFIAANHAQDTAVTSNQAPKKFMQITTIESVIGGGFGRSKMIITKEDGTQDEKEMENLFSMTGMNLKNIKFNESEILKTLKTYTDNGWKLEQVTPLTLSPTNNGTGIFMTRYLLSKAEEKKGF